ncbi:DUF3953 domain-containing protein [Viridibacillus sp. NPDC093762]|uniref:DUF3953 domain-containing protein n=1 Tax=Viridibacillus sp. NPDC093762 TaxID=3390720 RepID=UPI003CFC1442
MLLFENTLKTYFFLQGRLVTGLVELQKDRKRSEGYLFIIISLLIFFVSILDFLLN